MIPAHREIEILGKDFSTGALLPILDAVPQLARGQLLSITTDQARLAEQLHQWAQLTGNALVETEPQPNGLTRHVLRIGTAEEPEPHDVGRSQRLWFYANFDCNLACDYCCVRSSPTAERQRLDPALVQTLVHEAPAFGIRNLFVTGGEPFLHPRLESIIQACTDELPTTLLTNGMLFQGTRLQTLQAFPRDRLTLQISLDSPTPERHDAHRGPGTWQKAWKGIQTARDLGFRVRIAATSPDPTHLTEMDTFLHAEGFAPQDRVLRTLARRGQATEGIPLVRADLVPELTVTARGVYWHPVGATDDDLLITRDTHSLSHAWTTAQRMVQEDNQLATRLAEVFNCA